MNFTVYEHVNKYNNKRYIGITSKEAEKRWGKNGYNYQSNRIFFMDILKYGWINFEHNILSENLNFAMAKKIEKELILEYKTYDKRYGYNIRISDNWSDEDKVRLKNCKTAHGKEKQRKVNSKRVYCDGIVFDSMKECAKYYNLNQSTLSNWLNGYINIPNEYKSKDLKFI